MLQSLCSACNFIWQWPGLLALFSSRTWICEALMRPFTSWDVTLSSKRRTAKSAIGHASLSYQVERARSATNLSKWILIKADKWSVIWRRQWTLIYRIGIFRLLTLRRQEESSRTQYLPNRFSFHFPLHKQEHNRSGTSYSPKTSRRLFTWIGLRLIERSPRRSQSKHLEGSKNTGYKALGRGWSGKWFGRLISIVTDSESWVSEHRCWLKWQLNSQKQHVKLGLISRHFNRFLFFLQLVE